MVPTGTVTVNAASYQATAAMMGKDGGLSYRYGPATTLADAGLPTWGKRTDSAFPPQQSGLPGERNCAVGTCGTYQLGTLESNPGGYSSNIGHAAYVPDTPATYIGVIDLAISSVSNAVFSQKPELSWTLPWYNENDFNAESYRATATVENPVTVGRCYGRPGWCLNTLMVFQNGFIGTAGNNTSWNQATAQLGTNKVPTGIAVTNSGEFALVTVWDTVALRGEVAVIALAGLANGATVANPNPDPSGPSYWGEWRAVYPGLPNIGNYAFMKVLGYIPLPDMTAPTEISATTGWDPTNALFAGDSASYASSASLTLSVEANRNTFKDGGSHANAYAKTGVAVVISKSEQKVAFIDLKPLFQYYKKMYFGTNADFAATTNLGQGANQWPLPFSAAPEQIPTVIKTVGLNVRPTAVKTYQWGANKRAWVAGQDGALRIYNLGDYPTTGAGSAASIVESGSVTGLGTNLTDITYAKVKAGSAIYPDPAKELIVTSRGNRSVTWVRLANDGNSGTVMRTLQDTRLKDPIASEDTDNHSTESYVLSVADYGGKQIANYRYGPVIMWNYPTAQCKGPTGCGMLPGSDGTGCFEFGGGYTVKGKAFKIVGANIP